jgi:hypothetical protein
MDHPVGVPMNDYMFALKDWPFGASVSHVGIARYEATRTRIKWRWKPPDESA